MKFKNLNFNQLRPEFFFLIIASAFGLLILIITPPYQVPDEIHHFYKAYQVSEGQFISINHDNRIGGYIPESIVKSTEPFRKLNWSDHLKTSYDTIRQFLKTPLAVAYKRKHWAKKCCDHLKTSNSDNLGFCFVREEDLSL